MSENDAARPDRLRQPAAIAGDDRNAAELRLGDDAAPGFRFPLAGNEEDPGLAIDRPHVGSRLAQDDVAEPEQPALQPRALADPQRPAAHKREWDIGAQRRDLEREVDAFFGHRVDKGHYAALDRGRVTLAAKQRRDDD